MPVQYSSCVHWAVGVLKVLSQLTFTCSKSTIETIEKGVKYV